MFKFFGFSSQPKALKKQPIPDKKIDSSEGIIKWETSESTKNNFPQQLLQNVSNSPVGSAAVDVWAEFVEGDGLIDEVAGNTLVNPKQTLDELHGLLSNDLALMDGFAFIQRYDANGMPSQRFHIPFEETRLGTPSENGQIDRIYHNPYYGIPKDYDENDTRWFYDYNPDPKFVKQQIIQHNLNDNNKDKDGTLIVQYPGQVFWFSIEKPLARVYPQPFYYSSVNWFQVDAEIQLFHERNIKNNMLLSVLINMHGDPSAPAGEAEAQKLADGGTLDQSETVGGMMDQMMKGFIDEKGGVLINWFKKDEEKATFEQFPTNSHHDLFTTLQNITADQIAIGTKVPRVLLGIGEAGKLGDTQEILNAIRMMQGRTLRKRNILKKTYEKVFGVADGTIKNINPVDIIPDNVWGALTVEEQRSYIKENFDLTLTEEEPEAPKVTIEEDGS